MFMTAILTYVFSEDLSLRPRRHALQETSDRALATFQVPSGRQSVGQRKLIG